VVALVSIALVGFIAQLVDGSLGMGYGVTSTSLLLTVGLFLETSGAIIILTPVLMPAAEAFGFDPVHFGVVIVFGLVIGLATPPVGLCLLSAAASATSRSNSCRARCCLFWR